MVLSSGARLGPYEILAPLGAGGMGEVYRARDTKLRRDVAVKVLPEHLADHPEALARFQREAQVLAALSHPNIVAIHDFGRERGIAYAVMELLEGETLRARLEKGGLPPRKAIEVALQLAQGLAAAYDKGIIHRDLKPENVVVTRDGRVKILDFGLARFEPAAFAGDDSATLSRHTRPGAVMGTVSYMAPEQVRGEEVSHRSDIFSLGLVLHEMLGGERPFRRDSTAETISAILKEDPPELPRRISPVLRRLVRRCLEKSPHERFQSARDLGFTLEAIAEAEVEPSGPVPGRAGTAEAAASIAVLPFTNLSPDREQDYFCEGMAEEIINALTKVEGLRVASRTSAFQFKEKSGDIRRIGEALNVKTVLEGSVRTAGNRLRVTAELVNVEDGYHLWSDRYDREREDVFAIQDEIARSIVDALKVKLVTAGEPRRPTGSLEAYHLYLKGQHNWYKRNKDSLQKAAFFFEQAVEKDPSFARAHARLADAYSGLAFYGFPPDIARARAKAAVERALALDESLPEPHAALGLIRYFLDWDWEGAEQELKRAIQLDPSYVLPYCWCGFLFGNTGRFDEAAAMARQAQELDPLSPYVNTAAGVALLCGDRTEQAIAEVEKSLEIDADFLLTHWVLGGAYVRGGMSEKAIAICERAVALSERASFYLGWLGWAYGTFGRRAEAEEVLRELSERAERDYVAPVFLAFVCGGLGRNDEAFDWLEKSCTEKGALMGWLQLPAFDPLRSDPRFQDLLRRMRLNRLVRA